LRPRQMAPGVLASYLFDPRQQRPLLMSASRYHAFLATTTVPEGAELPPSVYLPDDALLVVPGPYAVCAGSPETESER
jgi:hypothetical protein